MQLNEQLSEFNDRSVTLATVTYDPVSKLKEVELKNEIQFPMLQDEDVEIVNLFGILNENMEPGSKWYGVPHPGILIIDENGMVKAKLAEERYQDRPPVDVVLEAIDSM